MSTPRARKLPLLLIAAASLAASSSYAQTPAAKPRPQAQVTIAESPVEHPDIERFLVRYGYLTTSMENAEAILRFTTELLAREQATSRARWEPELRALLEPAAVRADLLENRASGFPAIDAMARTWLAGAHAEPIAQAFARLRTTRPQPGALARVPPDRRALFERLAARPQWLLGVLVQEPHVAQAEALVAQSRNTSPDALQGDFIQLSSAGSGLDTPAWVNTALDSVLPVAFAETPMESLQAFADMSQRGDSPFTHGGLTPQFAASRAARLAASVVHATSTRHASVAGTAPTSAAASGDADALVAEAEVLAARPDSRAQAPRIIALLQQAAALRPDHVRTLTLLGRHIMRGALTAPLLPHQRIGQYDQGALVEAAGHLEKARRLAPQDSEVLVFLGAVRVRQGKYAQAQEALEKAIALGTRSELARLNLADTFQVSGQLDAAIRQYTLLMRDPQTAASTRGAMAEQLWSLFPEPKYCAEIDALLREHVAAFPDHRRARAEYAEQEMLCQGTAIRVQQAFGAIPPQALAPNELRLLAMAATLEAGTRHRAGGKLDERGRQLVARALAQSPHAVSDAFRGAVFEPFSPSLLALVAYGVPMAQLEGERNLVSIAIESGNDGLVMPLLEAGARPHRETAASPPALAAAVRALNPAMVRLMLARGADVDIGMAQTQRLFQYLDAKPGPQATQIRNLLEEALAR